MIVYSVRKVADSYKVTDFLALYSTREKAKNAIEEMCREDLAFSASIFAMNGIKTETRELELQQLLTGGYTAVGNSKNEYFILDREVK